jgi:hypothetical protein
MTKYCKEHVNEFFLSRFYSKEGAPVVSQINIPKILADVNPKTNEKFQPPVVILLKAEPISYEILNA